MAKETIHKLKKHQSFGFTPIDNETFFAISAIDGLAASIWVYLLCKPQNWIVRPTDVQKHFKIGRKSYYARLKVLREFGVYWNTADQGADGKFRNGTIHVSALPEMTSKLPNVPKGHTAKQPEPSDPEGHPGAPNRYTGEGECGKRAPLQKKESLQKKNITNRKSDEYRHSTPKPNLSTRARTLSDDLNDRTWAYPEGSPNG